MESHPVPEEVEKLEIPEYSNENDSSDSEPEDGDDEFMIDEEDVINGDAVNSSHKLEEATGTDVTELDPELHKLLEKVALKRMEGYTEVSLFTSSDDQLKTFRTCRKVHRHRS